MFLLILITLLKMTAAITARVLTSMMMMIYDTDDNAIMEYDRRECNSEMNVNKRICLNGCVNEIYSFNCHKNAMALKEMKTNEESLPGAG